MAQATPTSSSSPQSFIPLAGGGHAMAVAIVDSTSGQDYAANDKPKLAGGVDRSGTATLASAALAAANPARRGLRIQNVSAGNIGVNEHGGAAVIGGAGTFTLAAGGTLEVQTNRAVSVIGSAAGLNYTATEL